MYSIEQLLDALPKLGLVQDDVLTGPPIRIFGLPVWPGREVAVLARHAQSGMRLRLDRYGNVHHMEPVDGELRATMRSHVYEDRLAATRPLYNSVNDGWPGHW